MIPVTIVNPERLPEANRRWHRSACACRGDLSACPTNQNKQKADAA